jgi:23S rRNA pseudouridine1911/1915/1917 synthase
MKIKTDTIRVGERLDAFLATELSDYSRSYLANLIKSGKVLVNKKIEKPKYNLKSDDIIEIDLVVRITDLALAAENIDLDIIYEDENILVLNKQAGIVVHPGAGNPSGTLVNALIAHFPKIKEAVFEKGNLLSESRPGLVHRLDKDTSGVILVAKNTRSLHSLAKQIQNRSVKKQYLALCYGWPANDSGALINYIGRDPKNRKMMAEIGQEHGREAISDYVVKKYFTDQFKNKLSLIQFKIQTGRTHQIRLQSKLMRHPVMGDVVYNSKESLEASKKLGITRQLLHAEKIVVHLLDQKNSKEFTAPIPEDFANIISGLMES